MELTPTLLWEIAGNSTKTEFPKEPLKVKGIFEGNNFKDYGGFTFARLRDNQGGVITLKI